MNDPRTTKGLRNAAEKLAALRFFPIEEGERITKVVFSIPWNREGNLKGQRESDARVVIYIAKEGDRVAQTGHTDKSYSYSLCEWIGMICALF